MPKENFVSQYNIENKNKFFILEIALLLNKELFDDNEITYQTFKTAENCLLNQIKNINSKDI